MADRSDFATLLANHMRLMKMGAQILGRETNIPKQTIEGWLDGKRPRDWRSVCKVAQLLGVSRADLDLLLVAAGHPPTERLFHRCLGDEDHILLERWSCEDRWLQTTPINDNSADGLLAVEEVPLASPAPISHNQDMPRRAMYQWYHFLRPYSISSVVLILVIAGFWLVSATDSPQVRQTEMRRIPASTSLQGSTPEQIASFLYLCEQAQAGCHLSDFDDELPQHQVTISTFWIDRFEVTNAAFQVFTRATGYQTTAERVGASLVLLPNASNLVMIADANWRHPEGPITTSADRPDHPVVQVSYADAVAYCTWAGQRLPTEAEWEKAARGSEGQLFPWGNVWEPHRLNFTSTMTPTLLPDGPRPVGSYGTRGASPYGVEDMLGNVAEWVADWYDPTYYATALDQNPRAHDPESSQDMQVERVVRGGGWGTRAGYLHAAWRRAQMSEMTTNLVGFRCAYTP